jgi:hypothetical protein
VPKFGSLASVLSLGMFICVGCQDNNAWRRFYEASSTGKPTHLAPSERVEVRVATVEQFNEAFANIKSYFDEHKLAPEDMTPGDGRAVRQIMLDALRVRVDAQSVARLGVSSFISQMPSRPDDAGLVSFAKSIGADFVVMASEYGGERPGYSMAPVMSQTNSNVTANVWGSGGWAQGNATGSSNTMTFVPVPVTYQQWSNVAVYWRRVTPAERAMLDADYGKH